MKLRKELKGIKRIVIKIGSNVITKSNGAIDNRKMRQIVEDIVDLVDSKIEVVLVSSGAVSLGKSFLKEYVPRSGKIDLQHSASSIGQPKLINTYSRIFEENKKICSQILLTHDDFRDRKRFLHTKQNIEVLLRNRVTPILNENDSISYTENSVGDNDHLAAQTAQMVNADLLLMITSTDGLYDKDPHDKGATKISYVPYSMNLNEINTTGKTNVGRGGMESKIHAISKITPLGISALIATKNKERMILSALTNSAGTLFYPRNKFDPEQRKAWVLSMKKPKCYIDVDRGAFNALLESKSLLPTGIVDVDGNFYKGDCIELRCDGRAFASGVCEYSVDEVKLIMGSHSDGIEDILGFKTSCEVVHTINIVLEKDLINERVS